MVTCRRETTSGRTSSRRGWCRWRACSPYHPPRCPELGAEDVVSSKQRVRRPARRRTASHRELLLARRRGAEEKARAPRQGGPLALLPM
jgi:hypothetical protein